MDESRRVLCITGATGFVGRYLLEECRRRSSFSVRVLMRNPKRFDGASEDLVRICKGDLLDQLSLTDFLSPASTVLHLAYLRHDDRENLRAAANLIEAARRANVARVVYCSTATVVGFRWSGVVSEDTPVRPENAYQKTKYALEQMFRERLLPRIELAILRPTEIIGPGGPGLRTTLRRLRHGNALRNGLYRFLLHERRLNYVSVQNVVEALILLATTQARQAGDVYLISDDEDQDNNYLTVERIIREMLGEKPVGWPKIGLPRWLLRPLFRLLPGHSNPDRVYSHSKLNAIGYRPVTSLRSAVVASVSDWMTGAGDFIARS